MPVQNDPFQITPYQSSVPLVQIPPEAIESASRPAAPLQGEFGKKGTSGLAIGDALMKGFIQGHQQKAERNFQQANAEFASGSAQLAAAKSTYQQAIDSGQAKPNDPNDPAFKAYQEAAAPILAKLQPLTVQQKQSKGQGGDKKGEKKPAFSNFKDFFAANPHIIPSLAMMAMTPQPLGKTQEGQQQVQNLESQKLGNQQQQQQLVAAKQKQDDLNFVAMHQSLSDEQIKALPADEQKQLAASKYRLEQTQLPKEKFSTWQSAEGNQFVVLPAGEQPPPGFKPYEKLPTNESQTNMYYDAAARAWGTTRDKLSVQQLEYVDAMRARTKAQSSGQTTYTYTTTDVNGDHHSVTKKVSDPLPTPAGLAPLPDRVFSDAQGGMPPPPAAQQGAKPVDGGISKPPTASAAPTGTKTQGIAPPPQGTKTAKTGITPPPGGKQTALTASVTRQAVTKQQEGYQKAEDAYTKTIAAADKAFAAAQHNAAQSGDQSILVTAQAVKDRDYAQAIIDREKAKASVAKEYDAAVKSIGGTTGGQGDSADNPPTGASARVKDANGKLIGYAVNGQFVPLGQ